MRQMALLCILTLLTLAQAAGAGQTFEVGTDSLLNSQQGTLVRGSEPGVGGATYHFVESSATRIRIYGIRQYGSDEWQVYPTPVYLCPWLEMLPGDAWKFLDDDFGNSRTAEVIRQEFVDVPAGSFPNAWRIEVTRDDQPSVINEVYWYALDVGLVKYSEREGGELVRKFELQSYDVSGPGYFPLDEGNLWQFTDGTVEAGARSLGTLKDLFNR